MSTVEQQVKELLIRVKALEAAPKGRSTQGIPGTNGATILSGSDAPSDDEGNNGDVYFRSSNKTLYSKSGDAWSLLASLKGDQGDPGEGANLAEPGPIGGTTPSTGAFTGLTASSNVVLSLGVKVLGPAPEIDTDSIGFGVADIAGANTGALKLQCEGGSLIVGTMGGGVGNVLEISVEVANDGTIALPAPTATRFGQIELYTDGAYGKWLISPDGTCTLTSFAVNCDDDDTDTMLCVYNNGGVPTIKNRLDAAKWLVGTYRWG